MNKIKSPERILDKLYKPRMHWKTFNRGQVIRAMEEYASQFKQPNISEDVLQELGEKEIMTGAFGKVMKMFESRTWLMEGRGLYPYDDDRYKEEIRYLFDEFDSLQKDVWANIKTKTFEYRNKIIENYKVEQHISIVDEHELWNEVMLEAEASISYPDFSDRCKKQFSITRK